jgi:aminoglycoside phosphotransferase (APT) family kinase protein
MGREILSYLAGETVGDRKPWPEWVHSDAALVDVGKWLRRYHSAVAGFTPPSSVQWRLATHSWQAGDIIGHNDAAPYNAVWRPNGEGLVGFIDWDFAAPCTPIVDLAFTVCSWVPLHARQAAAAKGFADFEGRARRLRVLLDAYGFSGSVDDVLFAVRDRIARHIEDVRNLADAGDPMFRRLVAGGTLDDLKRTQTEFDRDIATLRSA